MPKTNCSWVTAKFLECLDVKAHSKTVARTIESHPEYPSVLALSDSLLKWKVEHDVYKFDKEDVSIADIPLPFIAHSMNYGGRFLLVEHIDSHQITYSDEGIERKTIKISDFMMLWDGVALIGKKTSESGEENYIQGILRYTLESLMLPALIFLIISSFLFLLPDEGISTPLIFVMSIKSVGITACILLLIQSINSNNPFIQNLCSIAGKGKCDELLKSDAAKITDWLNWSEVGFFYFVTTFLLMIKSGSTPLIALCSLLVLPFTIYSLTYQYKKQTWCILCCIVQLVLISDFVTLAFLRGTDTLFKSSLDFLIENLFFIIYVILVPVVSWSFFKGYFKTSVEFLPLQKQLNKFKYDSNLFAKSVTNQPRFAISDDLHPVIFGNPNAQIVITMISNLYCGPCGKAHTKLKELIDNRPDVQLKVVFVTNNFDDGVQWKTTDHIIALNLLIDKSIVHKALECWYKDDKRKYEDLFEKFPLILTKNVEGLRDSQKQWCDLVEIKFTPTLLINGYKLPEPYSIDDLKFLL